MTPQLFQSRPKRSIPSPHKPKSWTESVEGYLNEAKKLTTCLIRNRIAINHPYTWFLTIYVDAFMAPKDVNLWWRRVARKLHRNGLVALWVREPTRSNKVHYHLIVRSSHTEVKLVQIVEQSLPPRKEARWHKNLQPIDGSDWRLLHYVTKAKIGGKDRKGNVLPDLYAQKRLLFQPNLGIRKVGTIGKFWHRGKASLWQEVKAHEQRISDGLTVEIKWLAIYVHDLVGGALPLRQIERRLGFHADSASVQAWASRVRSARLDACSDHPTASE